MGNIYSESQFCDCGATHGSTSKRTRSGSSSEQQADKLSKTQVTLVEQRIRQGRTRSHSVGEMESKFQVKAEPFRNKRYQLRSAKEKDLSSDTRSAQVSSTRLLENELFQSFERLSLVTSTNFKIDDNGDTTKQRRHFLKNASTTAIKKAEDEMDLPKNVLYYGWFFSESASSVIHTVVMHYFRMCYKEVPQFQRFITTCCKDFDIRDPFEYYKRPGKRTKPTDPIEYHVTARFLGRDPDPPYQTLVDRFRGKRFYIHLTGLVFTPRTLGVRVKLTPAQQLIFDEKDESRNVHKSENSENVSNIQKLVQDEIDGYKHSYKIHKKSYPNCKVKMKNISSDEDDDKKGIIFKHFQQEPTTITPRSRAHITIGCAPNVKPIKTGEDLVDVIDLEQRPTTSSDSNFQQDFKLDRGVLRQFGKHANAFVLYADTEMIVPARFNVFI